MEPYLKRVREFHEKHNFASNNGHDMFFRMALISEEVGEICECLTKGKSKSELAEEHADLLILLLGNCIALDLDIERAFHEKMDIIMKRKAKQLDNGYIRVTES